MVIQDTEVPRDFKFVESNVLSEAEISKHKEATRLK